MSLVAQGSRAAPVLQAIMCSFKIIEGKVAFTAIMALQYEHSKIHFRKAAFLQIIQSIAVIKTFADFSAVYF